MLNRYGLVDGEDLLSETDEGLRRIERRYHESGSPEDRQRLSRALRRVKDPRGDKLHMEPHVKEWEAADHEHSEALTGSMYRTSHQKRLSAAKERRKKATDSLHGAAAEIERHPGEFFEKRIGEASREHVHRLATMAAHDDYGAGQYREDHLLNFRHPHDAAKHAESFNKSLQHHYPHWNPRVVDWASGSNVIHKGSVRFRAGNEWGQPHQPAEQK